MTRLIDEFLTRVSRAEARRRNALRRKENP
jgi:hypothetical protein